MRKLLYVLGALFLGILVLGGSGFAYLAYVGTGLDRQARQYADAAIPAIVGTWSAEALEQRATPDLLHSMTPKAARAMFAMFAELGPLVRYDGAKGQAMMHTTLGKGETVSADYVARAQFTHGDAVINLHLRKVDGVWKVDGFHVNSTDMIERAAGQHI